MCFKAIKGLLESPDLNGCELMLFLLNFATGDDIWEKYYEDNQSNVTEMTWEILDWYKKAVLLTREVDVEMEAIALSRIGELYDKIFKLKSNAARNFKRAIQLALSLYPQAFNNEG